jgi:hypothetical protein
MGIVFSDPELALEGGLDYFGKEEENVCVCPVYYPSGVEYHIRKQSEIMECASVIKTYKLKEKHKFASFSNAIKAIAFFRKMGKKLCVKKWIEEEKGYKTIKYYYLCSI